MVCLPQVLIGPFLNTLSHLWPFPRCYACTIYTWKRNSGQTLNVPSGNQCFDSDKKRIRISEVKIKTLYKSSSPLWNIKNGSPDSVSWYSFGIQEYPHDLLCNVIFPCSSDVPFYCCYQEQTCSGILKDIAQLFALNLLYCFFCCFCVAFHTYFDFCHFNLCRKRCICVVVELFNEFVSRREFYCCLTLSICSLHNTCPRTYVIR